MLIDVHAHIDVKEFDRDRDAILSDCDIIVVNAGVDLNTDLESVRLSRRYNNVIPAVGFHPEFIEKVDSEIENVLRLIDDVPIISEVGLDYFWIKDETLRRRQREVLAKFMSLAETQGKPLVIHSRGGLREIIDMVSSYKTRFAIHGYEGSVRDALEIVDLGGFLSFPPIILRDKGRLNVVSNLPEDSILTETDSPFMGPDRTRNVPCNVNLTLRKIAEVKRIEKEELEKKIESNFKRLLGPYSSLVGANLTKR
ncbi:MAG: TatD family hydrolase [Metallosphaera sp.]|uniref:TatD family hydrolase n=1 Tax=Metallosphaera sp. TaxID=2020860 RepID=UPI00316A7910